MAISKKPIALVAFITIQLVMMIHTVNSSKEVSFTFESFEPGDLDIVLEGDATISKDNDIHLTEVNDAGVPAHNSVGRASYSSPIRLWDAITGEVASISTSFNFFIKAPYDQNSPADGIAFFIAPHDSTLPPDSSGRFLGLVAGTSVTRGGNSTAARFKASSAASNKFVAVEFDTYTNHENKDPDYKHFGIDVNSIISSKYTEWTYWENGGVESVSITYDPVDKKLKVVGVYGTHDRIELSYDIDLKSVLPEWVKVGFSASTGENTQVNNLQSWSFSSTLVTDAPEGHIATVV
ncbi:lectin ConGF-like [Arachis stenosperma]|uniref:lectin ConGF-like n=1 Tax=Arachis stenosperma TaxID=217475 RepID=UPI0025AD6B17|nr:lectin ConGF-like [Arachis stenosperma]